MKHFDTLTTTKILFDHVRLMDRIITLMDSRGHNNILIHRYELMLADYIRRYVNQDESEKRRVNIAFSVKNLQQANLLADLHLGEGVMVFQPSLITLLRLCNSELVKELSDIEFKAMLSRLKELRNALDNLSFSDQNDDFRETRQFIFEHIVEIRSKLRSNELKMKQLSQRLSQIAKETTQSEQDFIENKLTMFREASQLSLRSITPALQFLDPHYTVDKGNLHQVIDSIREKFESHQRYEDANDLLLLGLNLLQSYQPIEQCNREVQAFLRKNHRTVREYNAMEAAYSALKEEYSQTLTKRLNRFYIQNSSSWVKNNNFVLGLKNNSKNQPKRLNIFSTESYLDGFWRQLQLRIDDAKLMSFTIGQADSATINRTQTNRLRRDSLILKIADKMRLIDTPDLHAHIHPRLSIMLSSHHLTYQLTDLLLVINRFKTTRNNIVTTLKRRKIADGQQAYRYQVVRFGSQGENNNDK
ncbi:hypothetical protein L4D77_14225 [Photobacterium frigidiphilum]|uniref:hypothetical protein n=1 Tax=Photobacterium frigidiphilum TaxID=264736 RepID=UPI003D0B154B